MQRRDVLKAAAAAAALTLLPADAHAAWMTAALPWPEGAPSSLLSAAQRATLTALADAIIPRTDTPSATDVGVVAWIDVVVAEYYTEADRVALTTGLDAIDAVARTMASQPFASLAGAALQRTMDALDAPTDRTSVAARGYARVKGLVVHGYFTSERVQRDVLRTQIMPGRFDGSAAMPAARGGRDE
jgi:gluconate 2-dehydrogenase gamma chain